MNDRAASGLVRHTSTAPLPGGTPLHVRPHQPWTAHPPIARVGVRRAIRCPLCLGTAVEHRWPYQRRCTRCNGVGYLPIIEPTPVVAVVAA